MGTYAETIAWTLAAYPMLYATGQDAAHALFCVVGNSYEWQGGALVSDVPHTQLARKKKVRESTTAS